MAVAHPGQRTRAIVGLRHYSKPIQPLGTRTLINLNNSLLIRGREHQDTSRGRNPPVVKSIPCRTTELESGYSIPSCSDFISHGPSNLLSELVITQYYKTRNRYQTIRIRNQEKAVRSITEKHVITQVERRIY